jgi:hypothetical protein
MRLRRRRRQTLLVAAGFAYLLAVAWLVSPVWRPAGAQQMERAPVSAASSGRPIGVAPLARPRVLPGHLPGSTVATTGASETGSTEPVGAAGTEATAVVPEESETSSSPPPSSGSSGQAHEETIIGFEG